MLSLLRELKPVANDLPDFPRRTALVIIRKKGERLFWIMAAGLVALLLIVAAVILWILHDVHGFNETAARSVTTVVADKAVNAGAAPAKPIITVEPTDMAGGIALPAEALDQPHDGQASVDNPSTIAFIAEKMGPRPLGSKPDLKTENDLREPDIVIDESDPVFASKTQNRLTPSSDTATSADLANAMSLLDDGHYALALSAYQNVLDRDPTNRAALRGKERALRMTTDDDQCRHHQNIRSSCDIFGFNRRHAKTGIVVALG